jgi:hypothetical protein
MDKHNNNHSICHRIYNTEVNAAIIVDEAEKLFNKLVKDCINKTITDHTFNKSQLPLLSSSNEEHTRSSLTAATTQTCDETEDV